MSDEVRERRAGERLREMIATDENLGPRIAKMIRDQNRSAQSILAELFPEDPLISN